MKAEVRVFANNWKDTKYLLLSLNGTFKRREREILEKHLQENTLFAGKRDRRKPSYNILPSPELPQNVTAKHHGHHNSPFFHEDVKR